MKKIIYTVWFAVFLAALLALTALDSAMPPPETNPSVAICQVNTVMAQAGGSNFITSIFETDNWPARWQCGIWTPFLGWLYIVSDLVIWLSYFMIPLILGFFVYKKKHDQVPFRFIVMLFIAFILACGLTHLVDAIIFWWPAYRLSALVRLGTATVSLGTVFALIQIAPRVLELKSPETLEKIVEERTLALRDLNTQLVDEINHRQQAEEMLRQVNGELQEKTRRLEQSNHELRKREQELREREDTIRELNVSLERKVEERTSQLNQTNYELEAFTYSVSHDLRAPLRAIDGYAKIFEEDYSDRVDNQGRRILSVITKNAKHMGNLIDDLLDFSRTSRTELVKLSFQTDDEVRAIAGELLAQESNRKIEINIKPLVSCYGDTTMLRQVWTNLLSNALKYTSKFAETRIEVGCIRHVGETEYYVKDNGVGFDMAYVDKLFGVFQRMHKKDEFEGTGVGLALAKRIIDRHDGRIWAKAEVNEGASFHFTLPVHETKTNSN
ncbi:MAG: sensor histidine kinase [Bacteroidota bacterium]